MAAPLSGEAIWLGRVLLALMPEEPEVMGLLSLMLYCEARKAARRAGGGFVPLDRQDVGLWDAAMMAEADICCARRASAAASAVSSARRRSSPSMPRGG